MGTGESMWNFFGGNPSDLQPSSFGGGGDNLSCRCIHDGVLQETERHKKNLKYCKEDSNNK
jgi:hypothetical protein